jgi:anti-anti-sigma regulatory factor
LTYRIQRTGNADRVVLALSGDMSEEHTAELQALLATEAPGHVSLDLKDVTLVDRGTVRFLARAETMGLALVNCPEYVRSWIAMEQRGTSATEESIS